MRARLAEILFISILLGLLGAGAASAGDRVESERGMAREYRLAVRALIGGDAARATDHYRNALHHADRASIVNERVASSCFELAMLLADAEHFAEAHRMMDRAYRTRLELLGVEHPDVRDTASALAALAAMVGQGSGEPDLSTSVSDTEQAFVGGMPLDFSSGTP
jgi:hypothetical protein